MATTCPACRSNQSTLLPARGIIVLARDQACQECGAHYTPPAPVFRGLAILLGVVLVLFGVAVALLVLGLGTGWDVPQVAIIGILGGLGARLVYRGVTCRAGLLSQPGFPVVLPTSPAANRKG